MCALLPGNTIDSLFTMSLLLLKEHQKIHKWAHERSQLIVEN